MPTSRSFTRTMATLSAAPMWSTIRRPVQRSGTSKSRTYRPVGFAAGTAGGRSGKGMTMFVYWGRSPVSCIAQLPGTVIVRHASVAAASAAGSSWKRHSPSRGTRSSWGTLCIGTRCSPVSSGAAQGAMSSDATSASPSLSVRT